MHLLPADHEYQKKYPMATFEILPTLSGIQGPEAADLYVVVARKMFLKLVRWLVRKNDVLSYAPMPLTRRRLRRPRRMKTPLVLWLHIFDQGGKSENALLGNFCRMSWRSQTTSEQDRKKSTEPSNKLIWVSPSQKL